jgi:hypothetical protein
MTDDPTTGGRVMVSEQRAPGGVGSPLHVHHREDEALAQLAASYGIDILGPPGIPS